jgi:hypothetical protein
VYYNCVKFHKNSISSLVGVALTRYMPPLQVVYYNCAKFHKNSISSLVGVALTRYMDERGDSYISPQTLFAGSIKKEKQ